MIFVQITGWSDTDPWMGVNAVEAVAAALRDQGVGQLDQLEPLPALVGPFDDLREAESMSQLLRGYGAQAKVVENPRI